MVHLTFLLILSHFYTNLPFLSPITFCLFSQPVLFCKYTILVFITSKFDLHSTCRICMKQFSVPTCMRPSVEQQLPKIARVLHSTLYICSACTCKFRIKLDIGDMLIHRVMILHVYMHSLLDWVYN